MTHITRAGASWLGNHLVTVTWARAGPPWRASLRFRALQPDVPDADAKRTSAVSSFPPPAAQPSRACKAPGDAEAGSQVELGDGRQVVPQLLVLAWPECRLDLFFGLADGDLAGFGCLAAFVGEVDALGPAVGGVLQPP